MKLIAETQDESRVLDRLSALLCDLGVAADGYKHDEAIAATFFSAEDFTTCDDLQFMTQDERTAFLCAIEDNMRSAMLQAGHRVIRRALRCAQAGISHPDRHLY